MDQRKKEQAQREGKAQQEQKRLISGHAWISVGMPNGNLMEVLVNEDRQVLAKRPMGSADAVAMGRARPVSAHI